MKIFVRVVAFAGIMVVVAVIVKALVSVVRYAALVIRTAIVRIVIGARIIVVVIRKKSRSPVGVPRMAPFSLTPG